jgi:hypothetical protein
MSISYLSILNTVNNNGGGILNAGNINLSQNYVNIISVNGNRSLDGYPRTSTPVISKDVQKSLESNDSIFAFNSPVNARMRAVIKTVSIVINNSIVSLSTASPGKVAPELTTNIHFRNINKNRLDTTAIRNGNFNFVNGKFTPKTEVVYDFFGTDNAAVVNRTNTGTITFLINKKPVTTNYLSKTT